MTCSDLEITTIDGLKLYGQIWEPDGEIQASISLVHGLGEHCARYHHVAEAFTQAGYGLITFDLRGHGRSEGRRGDTPDFTTLMEDISASLETAAHHFPNRKRFLFGHSLGGSLVIQYTLRRTPQLAGVIASAPLLQLAYEPPAWKMAALRIMNALHLHIPIPTGLDVPSISQDPTVVQQFRDDPLNHDLITSRMSTGMMDAGAWNLERAAEFPLPLLLMHGDADQITSMQATQEFAKKADCTLKIWNGLYHELHNEPCRQEVVQFVTEWMIDQI